MNAIGNHRIVRLVAIGALLLSACASDADMSPEVASTTSAPRTTTVPPTTASTPTTTAPTPTTTLLPPTALDELGYPVSDDWVVETVVSDLDSATGGLAIDADGIMYQADFGYSGHPGDTLYRIHPDGTIEPWVQSDDMASLTMTTFGPDGTLYQSSYGSDKVFSISPDGEPTLVAEGLRGPTGIVATEDGTLYIEAYNSNILHRVLPDGALEDFVFDRKFNGINGLAIGPDGTLYIADHKDGSLFAVSADGEVTKLHQFPKATSHVLYHDGSLYVTSRGAFVVFRYDLETEQVEIIAGNGEAGDRDGRGAEAQFGRPNAITMGPDGAIYINHGGGNANNPVSIKRITFQP